METHELNKNLDLHRKWLVQGEPEEKRFLKFGGEGQELKKEREKEARGELFRKKLLWQRADFRYEDLHRADFRGANLRKASMTGANLRGADLSGADLCYADLVGANLCDANLDGARIIVKGKVVTIRFEFEEEPIKQDPEIEKVPF